VAIYNSHPEAEDGVKALQKSGFDMKKLSIVGKDYHTEEHVVGYYNAGDRMKYWGKMGAFWGGLWGLLLGAGFFAIPGIGPVVVAGPLVGGVVGALEGAAVVGGLSALGAGLVSIGIPKDSVLKSKLPSSRISSCSWLTATRRRWIRHGIFSRRLTLRKSPSTTREPA